MGTIIYDARRVKGYEYLKELCAYANRDETFQENLWKELAADGDLMKEFAYYADHQTILDEMKCEGYTLTDLYVWQIEHYNLMQDYGKNGADCNKVAMILDFLYMMAQLKKSPEDYLKRLNGSLGMDRF